MAVRIQRMWDTDKRTPGGRTASTSPRSNQGERELTIIIPKFFTPLTSVINKRVK